jgi:curli biogenesis system outer membrane secretion channel CsgG
MKVLLVFVIALLTACAADPEKVQAVADAESARLDRPTRPLSSFSGFELKPMVFSTAIEEEEGKLEEAQEFEQNLNDKLLPLLESWNAASKEGSSGTLSIETELTGLRIVSGGARFWAGPFAGDSFIDMDLRLVDKATGEEIADVRVQRNAGAMGGSWSIGKTDQNLDEYIVTIIYDYLSDNYLLTDMLFNQDQ